jgi:hypothetical protein
LPLLAVVSAAAAIVLFWETSPRYSHCVHFAFAGVAAVGYRQFRRGIFPALTLGVRGKPFLLVLAAAGLLWVGFAAALWAGLRSASSYLFADIRHAAVTLAGQRLPTEPLHRWTAPWEQAIEIGNGAALPATLHIEWPAAGEPRNSGWNMSVWLPNAAAGPWDSCRFVAPAADRHEVVYALRDLAKMKRAGWMDSSADRRQHSLDVVLLPPPGQTTFSPAGSLGLAFGYMQSVSPNTVPKPNGRTVTAR